jgi:hypothetical protein
MGARARVHLSPSCALCGRSGWQSWNTASRRARSLRPCSPSGLAVTSGGKWSRHRSCVDSERSVWPPWPAASRRATRLSGAPKQSLLRISRTGVQRHAHSKPCRLRPALGVERPLRVECRAERIGRGMERRAERIAARLEHMAVVGRDALAHERVVPRQRHLHRCLLRLPKARAAFDVREQERHCAGGQRGRASRGWRTSSWRADRR